MMEEFVIIPKREYDFLLDCKQRLIDINNAEIQRCYNQMQEHKVETIVNNAIYGNKKTSRNEK